MEATRTHILGGGDVSFAGNDSAVDDDVAAGDVAGGSPAKENDEVGDFGGSAEASGGGVGSLPLDDCVGFLMVGWAMMLGDPVVAEPEPGSTGPGPDGVTRERRAARLPWRAPC